MASTTPPTSADSGEDATGSRGTSPGVSSSQSHGSAFASAFGAVSEPVAPSVKRKRNRMILSCQPCHQRKQQCDRGQPCQRCIHRGSPSECIYDSPSDRSQKRLSASLNDRLGQLETVIQDILGDLDPSSLAGLDALLHMIQSGDFAGAKQPATPSGTRPPVVVPAITPRAGALPTILVPVTPGWAYVPSPPTTESLTAQFPSHGIRTFLLSHFFDRSSLHWIWPIVHRPVFDGCYMAFTTGQPQSLDFIALLAIICASSLQFLPETPQDAAIFAEYPYGRRVLQRRLYDIARMLLVAPQVTPYPSIERIQGLVVFAVYNENEGALIESYHAVGSAIRMAQAFAMHRDAQAVWRMRPYEAEQRRRFWWILYCLDRMQGAMLRRPYIILDQHCDVSIPMNLDQAHLLDVPNLVGLSPTKPTEYLFQIEQVKWAQLVGHLWDRCFGIKLPTYRLIIDIEDEIRRYEAEIASPLNAKLPPCGDSPPYLAFQRQYITSQISHLRILLTRQFLFALPQTDAQPPSHREYLTTFSRHARTVCIYYCKQLLSLSHLMQKQSQSAHLRWTSTVLRVFDAAIAVVMDSSDHSKGLEVWIVLAREVLRSLVPQNSMAGNAFSGVDAICKRVQSIIGQRYPMPSLADSDAHAAQVASSSRPPPSLGDLLGPELTSDPVWSTIEATVFAGNLPGLEAMCGPMLAHAMIDFLSNCLAGLRQ